MALFPPFLFLRINLIPRVTETSLKQSQMETMKSPREGKISLPVLGKMSIKEKNNTINRVAESMESIVDKIATQNKSPFPRETSRSKAEDEIFDKMTVKMVSGIPECKEKDLLKLGIQQDVTNTRFSAN